MTNEQATKIREAMKRAEQASTRLAAIAHCVGEVSTTEPPWEFQRQLNEILHRALDHHYGALGHLKSLVNEAVLKGE